MKLFLIDGIGPFFRNIHIKRQKINWSKIPFHHFPKDPEAYQTYFRKVAFDVDTFSKCVSKIGYNSITFDDVPHITPDEWIEPEINQLLVQNRNQFAKIFNICSQYGLDIYLTMDILSLTPGLQIRLGNNSQMALEFIQRQIDSVFAIFPEVKGIIIRIGECDGKDVKGIFRSQLFLKTPQQVNSLIKTLLPIFKRHNRLLILRNWSVGAYPIGDFLWHRRTMNRVLRKIDSPHFALSLKFGESDFFRYLPLNEHFFTLEVQKIIELQTKREYEGCGEFPSFIGWDYHAYAKELDSAKNMIGMSVWCQTGGWVPFRRITYLEPSAIWNELNTYASIKIFKEKQSVIETIYSFADDISCPSPEKLLAFLKLNDEVIKKLLYIEEVAEQKLFFRRVRIPPLLSVFWNNIFINHSVRKLMQTLVSSGDTAVNDGYEALKKISTMESLATELQLPVEDIRFMYDTFHILALAREYYFLPYDPSIKKRIKKTKRRYKKKYPKDIRFRYRIKTNFSPFSVKKRHIQWVLGLFLRDKRGYRVLDHLLTLHLLAIIYRFLVLFKPDLMPSFARKHAMGIDTIFK